MKFARFWGPAILVMAMIFGASSMSDPGPPPGGLSDKGAHFLAFGALGAALVRALAEGRPREMTMRRVVLAFVLGTLYGLSDELHQRFVPNRSPELFDLFADACGALAGAVSMAVAGRLVHRLILSGTKV